MIGPYLLDTNILVQYVRDDSVWRRIQTRYSLLLIDPKPGICAVTVGELRSLALQWNWQVVKRNQMDFILSYVQHYTIARDPIYKAYATIETYTRSIGRRMGKNDLWIAATAAVTGAHILTTDHDFDHLSPKLVQLEWIDPALPAGGTP